MELPRSPIPQALAVWLLLSAMPLSAQPPTDDVWQVRFESGALFQADSNLDRTGQVGIDAWSVLIGADRGLGPDLRLGLSAGYGERDYRFDGDDGFAGLRPWSKIRDLRVSATASWKVDERWNLFAVPTMRWSAESGASLDDGRFGGLLAAASFKVNDRLSIGPGFGVFSELEDDADWFPVLAIDWRFADNFALRTGRGFGASRGPGLRLDWTPSDRWQVSLGARYEKFRFRLDEDGLAADGIGQETSIPVYLGATRRFGPNLSLSVVAGVEFDGELRLEDARGDLIDRTHFENAPFGAATLDLRF